MAETKESLIAALRRVNAGIISISERQSKALADNDNDEYADLCVKETEALAIQRDLHGKLMESIDG